LLGKTLVDLGRAALDVNVQLARTTGYLATAAGARTAALVQAAPAQLQQPLMGATQAQFQQAPAGQNPGGQMLGLSEDQIRTATARATQLAQATGTSVPQAQQAMQAALRGDVGALQQLGINVQDAYGGIRGLSDLTNDELVQALGAAGAA